MLNKLLKTSLILVLAITLTACNGNKKKKTPGDGLTTEARDTLDCTLANMKNSDFCLVTDGKTEAKPADTKLKANFAYKLIGDTDYTYEYFTYEDESSWTKSYQYPIDTTGEKDNLKMESVITDEPTLNNTSILVKLYDYQGKEIPADNIGMYKMNGSGALYLNYPDELAGKQGNIYIFYNKAGGVNSTPDDINTYDTFTRFPNYKL